MIPGYRHNHPRQRIDWDLFLQSQSRSVAPLIRPDIADGNIKVLRVQAIFLFANIGAYNVKNTSMVSYCRRKEPGCSDDGLSVTDGEAIDASSS